MDIIQKLLCKVTLSISSSWRFRLLPTTPEKWRAYWEAQGQSWRKEPEIDQPRRAELAQRREIIPDVKQGIYPFRGLKLSRADVEWLLATHENGRGPVIWNDEKQRNRRGLDLRGADLSSSEDQPLDLSFLPLSCLCGGPASGEWSDLTEEQRAFSSILLQNTDLSESHLEHAILSEAHLERALMDGVYLEGADLFRAHLSGAWFGDAHLENANLGETSLERASLSCAHLEGTNLARANLTGAELHEAHLEKANLKSACLVGADLTQAYLDGALLENIIVGDSKGVGPKFVDTRWGETNLSVVDWSQVTLLSDEKEAKKTKSDFHLFDEGNFSFTIGGTDEADQEKKGKYQRLKDYQQAVRANRQLAVILQNQGLNEDAARFAYRAQFLQKTVFRYRILQSNIKFQQRLQFFSAWLFSWSIFLLAGYGYKPERSFLVYLLVIVGFTALYLKLDNHLAWYEAVVVSMTAFHGRGFSPSTFSPGDPLSIASAFEAFVGLIIEVTFIATLTQRFFNK